VCGTPPQRQHHIAAQTLIPSGILLLSSPRLLLLQVYLDAHSPAFDMLTVEDLLPDAALDSYCS
jgi:hypothetical protein